MYPITCLGGYPIPIKKGRFAIMGIVAVVNDTASASRVTLVDSDEGKEIPDSQSVKPVISDMKGLANGDATLGIMFAEPIKVRHGITITSATTNIVAGRTLVYIQ
jgi:hypothetical protein